MQTNFTLLLGSLLFNLLFYKQSFGLNTVVFTAFVSILFLLIKPKELKQKESILLLIVCIISSLGNFYVGTVLSAYAWFVSFLLFIGSLNGIKNSLFVKLINGLYVAAMGFIHDRLQPAKSPEESPKIKVSKSEKNTGFIVLSVVITILFVMLFSYLYSLSNPTFQVWIASIDISFINFSWLLFTLLGFLFLKNMTSNGELDILTAPERELENTWLSKKDNNDNHNHKRTLLGTILMAALCLLIVVYLISDILHFKNTTAIVASDLSTIVHEGVNALIISILLAIGIILTVFSRNIHFYKSNRTLKLIASIWIILNILIVLITCYKNYLYSFNFGLTYKRVGVFIYLLLCISGLITTLIKIHKAKKIIFLFQKNLSITISLFLLLSCLNWSKMVTSFNLENNQNPDLKYLLRLDKNNSNLLHEYSQKHSVKQEISEKIEARYSTYNQNLKNQNWQETTLNNLYRAQ